MNRQLNQKDIIKVLGIVGASVVVLLIVTFVVQRTQTNSAHAESLRIQALELGHSPEANNSGSGPLEEEGQRSDPNFVP